MFKVEKRKFSDGTKSKTYWYRGTVNGTEIFKSTKRTGHREAKQYAQQKWIELTSEAERSSEKRFFDAIEAYKRKGGEDTHLFPITELLGMEYLEDINQALIDEKAREAYPTQSDATVKRCWYDPISAILNYAAELEWTHWRKIKKPKPKRPAPKWAEPEWFEAFWPHCSKELKALTTLLPYTGCRISELMDLEWSRVNLKERWCYIPDTKNDLPRTVSLPQPAIKALKSVMPEKPIGRVFTTWKDYTAVNRIIRKTVKKANEWRKERDLEEIAYLSSHQIGSHTYATWMRRYAGMDPLGLARTGRWKSVDSTQIYTHTVASEESRKSDLLPTVRAKNVQKKKKA